MRVSQTISVTRDPRVDPQPGDEVRCGGLPRRVIRREGAILWCHSGGMPYRIRLDVWQKWCLVPTPSRTIARGIDAPI